MKDITKWKLLGWVFGLVFLFECGFIGWQIADVIRITNQSIHRLKVNEQETRATVDSLRVILEDIRNSANVHEIRLNGFDKERLDRMKKEGIIGK